MGWARLGHQVCLAHLIRDVQYAIDAGDTVLAPGLKGLLKRACAIGRRREALADSTLKVYQDDLNRRLDRLMSLVPTTRAGAKLHTIIRKGRRHLFVFMTNRDVTATNNGSERALRPCAVYRKITNGFRSHWGAVLYADIVRHITRRWIPFAERRGLEDMTLGPTAYLAAKAKGDRSMPSKRERSEDADDPVPQGPRDTVRTGLFEPQPPTMQPYIPRHSVLRRGHRDRATRMSSLEPSTRWAMGHHPIQGGERGTYVALDTSSTTGMWDRPTRREAQGDGAAVVCAWQLACQVG